VTSAPLFGTPNLLKEKGVFNMYCFLILPFSNIYLSKCTGFDFWFIREPPRRRRGIPSRGTHPPLHCPDMLPSPSPPEHRPVPPEYCHTKIFGKSMENQLEKYWKWAKKLTAASARCTASADTTTTRTPNLMAPLQTVLGSMAHRPRSAHTTKNAFPAPFPLEFPEIRSRRRAAGLCLVVMPRPLQCPWLGTNAPCSLKAPHHSGAALEQASLHDSSLSRVPKRAQKHAARLRNRLFLSIFPSFSEEK
jgi:hypothetical protein